MESERIRVAILEDQQVFREALVAVLEGAGMDVVADFGEPAPFFARVRETLPHVALVDLRLELPGWEASTSGMSALQCLHDFFPAVKPLVLSGHREAEVVEQCLQAGAAGYLWKQNVGCAEVVEAVERVVRGERLLPAGLAWPRPEASPRGELGRLTPREREVLGYIAAGADNLRIAACLGITERTVKAHITAIYKKVGSENRTQLAVLGCQLGVQRPASL
ncbi:MULTISPECIES: response regulator transcription factor [Myxococcus]|uniref:DNA-binding response regulator n=1 Tax=Myxococcus virescens TaxID=83456 RepID=A0A511HHP5_9BACT|nr:MULTISPECIES: response regulator transcription factor [Myxococcus]NOJ53540.1 response regulator transcription factor [Myxococcus xanthus]QDE88083.1 DNA-binding response regulator [Myxococcus xanthus]QPM80407.1 response regulator transcription factor [Myxococcus xanthus]QQR45227.1 response regulator transcription factor [Myxococcus xanthus]QVW69469.1 response regulator transcription factor [Myxococcus xanthus DZ2]